MRIRSAAQAAVILVVAVPASHAQTPAEALDQGWVSACAGATPGTPFYDRCQEILNAGPGSGARRSEAASGNNLEITGAAGRTRREEDDQLFFELREGRWNAFLSGSTGWEARNPSLREHAYDAGDRTVIAGLDYLVSSSIAAGVGLGYSSIDVDFERGFGRLRSHEYRATGVFSASFLRFASFDAHCDYAFTDHGAFRNIDYLIVLNRGLPTQETRRVTGQAIGNVRGHRVAGGGGLSGDLRIGPFTFQPRAGLETVSSWNEPYTEQDNAGLALSYDRQDGRSLATTLGLTANLATSHQWGVLNVYARGDHVHELEAAVRTISAHFVQDAAGYRLSFITDAPDRDYVAIGGGLVAILPGGFSAYIDFAATIGNQLLQQQLLSMGWRASL